MEINQVNSAPQGSIAQLLDDRLALLEGEYGAESSTSRGYKSEAAMFRMLLGPRRELWLPAQVGPDLMALLCRRRASTLDPQTNSIRQCLNNLRFLLRDLGFKEETYSAIKAPKRRKAGR